MIREWLKKRRESRVRQQEVVIRELLSDLKRESEHSARLWMQRNQLQTAYDNLKAEISLSHGDERTSPASDEETRG